MFEISSLYTEPVIVIYHLQSSGKVVLNLTPIVIRPFLNWSYSIALAHTIERIHTSRIYIHAPRSYGYQNSSRKNTSRMMEPQQSNVNLLPIMQRLVALTCPRNIS